MIVSHIAHNIVLTLLAKAAVGKISYTSDIWSSADRTPYMAMTAHWMAEINSHLKLQSALVAFQRVWGKHTAKNLANIMLCVLDHAVVTTNVSSLFTSIWLILIQLFKIRHVNMDNLQTNTKAMEELEILLHTHEIPFNAKEQCVMCFPHIVNIICQHLFAKMSSSALSEDVDDDNEEDLPKTQTSLPTLEIP